MIADAAQAARQDHRGSSLRAGCLLALICVVAKAFCETDPRWSGLGGLIAASSADVAFALICGVLGEALLLAVERWTHVAKTLRVLLLVCFAVLAWYAVAAVGLFAYFNRPLTYDLLGMVGNAATVRSSIVERITFSIGFCLIAVPALFLLWSLVRRPRLHIIVAGYFIGAIWIASGWSLQRRGHQAEALEFLSRSPHYELVRTALAHVTGRHRPAFPRDFPPEYVDEFRSFGGRAGAASRGFELPAGVARPRNVIVVILESVGTKHLALYGSPLEVTPNLTAAARNALVFDNFYAHASFTYASFRPINFSVFPGLPWHYSLLEDARPLPATLASVMQSRGSRTGYFTSGDLDWGTERWLLSQAGAFGTINGGSDLGCPLLSSWGAEDRCLFDRLREWIAENPRDPFFAVCWTDQTHDPFLPAPNAPQLDFVPGNPKPPFASDLSRYLNNLHAADAQLGRLFATLRDLGIADDTLVVVTGDHGEAFADPHPQRGHAWSVFEEETRVPLLFWNPKLFPDAQHSATIGGHVDFNPTLADLLDVEPPSEWQGHSLFDPAHPQRAFFMAIGAGNTFGVRDGDWKYIFDVTTGRESLFNLAADPTEQHDAAATEPGRCAELRRRVAAWVTFEDAYLWGREN